MDAKKLAEARHRMAELDERLAHKVRHRPALRLGGHDPQQNAERLRDLSAYVLELRTILGDLLDAFDARPPAAPPGEGGPGLG